MTTVSKAKTLITSIVSKVGAAEFSRLSGVPYTTLRDMIATDFSGTKIDNFDLALTAARKIKRQIRAAEAA